MCLLAGVVLISIPFGGNTKRDNKAKQKQKKKQQQQQTDKKKQQSNKKIRWNTLTKLYIKIRITCINTLRENHLLKLIMFV